MGDAIRKPASRAEVRFEVERLECDGDELIVSGHWSGLRGVRFMRPTLVVDDRPVLATLEHKPWAPRADATWTAAFPWKGGTPQPSRLSLAVAPSVTVALASAASPADLEPPAAGEDDPRRDDALAPETASSMTDRMRLGLAEAELEAAIEEREDLRLALDDARRRLHEGEAARVELEAALRRERRRADTAAADRDELARARTAAERNRDLAREQRDEAVADREAAMRARSRMELANAEATEARAAAAADVERANAERDEAKAQRDEVLLAYRALQRHIQTERAELDREQSRDDAAETADDEPLGVRTMPAARTVMAELQRPPPARKFAVSGFDVWVFRVLGCVAAACFILLLVSLIRVFI